MSSVAELSAQLEQTLLNDIPVTDQLLTLLEQERTTLEKRQFEDYQQLLADKQQLLLSLENNAHDRRQHLANAGFENEASTLEALDKYSPDTSKAWRTLSEKWQQCQELNEINDRISKRTRLVVGQVLDILRGQNNQDKLYTKQGNTKKNGGGRPITSA